MFWGPGLVYGKAFAGVLVSGCWVGGGVKRGCRGRGEVGGGGDCSFVHSGDVEECVGDC